MRIISLVSLPPAPCTSDPHSPTPASHDIAKGAKDNRQHHKSQGRHWNCPGKPLQPGPRIADADLRVERLSVSHGVDVEQPINNIIGDEIGRASCRERECQEVWISVVAVSYKKKHITMKEYMHIKC